MSPARRTDYAAGCAGPAALVDAGLVPWPLLGGSAGVAAAARFTFMITA